MRILLICTGNSCRSQMAHGLLQSMDGTLEVFSAGSAPSLRVSPYSIEAMREAGIDISEHTPRDVREYWWQDWDYVITLCDRAAECYPVFRGRVGKRLHIGFDDPAASCGTPEEILDEYRATRDEIKEAMREFYDNEIGPRKA